MTTGLLTRSAIASNRRGPLRAEKTTANAINTVELATGLAIAWPGNPDVRVNADEVPAFLKTIRAALGESSNGSGAASAEATSEYAPAVPVRSPVKPDHIVSLITGQKLKSLKRHLASHGLTPGEYRERYGLKPDYPMVAPSYAAQRRDLAVKIGLGRKGRAARAALTEPTSAIAQNAAVPAPAKAAAKPARKAAPKPKASAKPKADAKPAPVKRPRAKKVAASAT